MAGWQGHQMGLRLRLFLVLVAPGASMKLIRSANGQCVTYLFFQVVSALLTLGFSRSSPRPEDSSWVVIVAVIFGVGNVVMAALCHALERW